RPIRYGRAVDRALVRFRHRQVTRAPRWLCYRARSMSTASTPNAEPAGIVGSTISGRYRIERLLGEGGMGAVYQAEHTLMHKRVAVKVLHAEMSLMSEVVTRFEREAMAAAHIEHPNVATATDFGKLDDGSFFLVLEFVEGH